VILHGFETSLFSPIPRDLARKKVGLPTDAFFFLSLNRNQPRKRYDILIMAFVELIVKYPTKPLFLMCVCDRGEKGGWWIFEIFQRELRLRNCPIEMFGNRLMLTSQDMSFTDEDINMFYNLADVGVSSVDGEGWGLCNFEQMGVGIPQVVPDLGGFKEFCNSENSIIVKPKHRYYLPSVFSPVGGEAHVCDPHDLCLGMEEYINDSEKRLQHGKKARETVLKYTWERAVEKLVKRLDEEKKEVFDE
jgi:glycosyltransferase involved in cell wall biosynthesis